MTSESPETENEELAPGGAKPGPPGDFDLDPREMRGYCFKLIREITGKLGWKYKLWIPAAILLSTIHLLPQRFLQFFTEGTQRLAETPADNFVRMLVLFGIAVAICQWIALVIDSILSEWLRLTVSIGLKKDAVAGLSRTRIDQLDSAQRGDWMTRMTGDLYNAEEFLTRSLPDQITNATMLVGSAALFFYYSGPIAFIPLVAALFLGWINIGVQRRMAPTLGRARMMEGGVFQSMIETFEGLRTIRSYGGERFTFQRIEAQLKDLFDAGMKITKSMALLMGVNEFVGQVIITGVLTLVAYQVRGGELTATDALVYPFYIGLFLGAAKSLVGSAYDWNRFFIEGGRLASLLYDDSKKERNHEELFGTLSSEVSEVQSMSGQGIRIAYGDAPPVIKNGELTLSRGEILAVMGPSGCGKSTIVESFSGLRVPGKGSFEVTLKDGRTTSYPQAPTFLSAFVEQQPYLFVGTIRDNIALGSESISDEEIHAAINEVGLTKTIEGRGGIDHLLSDRGRNLSVGQQYRLALCRALVCGRPFLLMDEPFAALDPESIELVIKAMKQERAKGTGIIIITHLLPPNLDEDRVLKLTPH
ncbi:MAG: ABC transporter ATP-binding protein [Verrucomicrobiales bacterium]|nr:ABC transporter ATP-binding protein [Verrucomicrobiales bacterium]